MNLIQAYIFNNLRILKAVNPGDTYYEEYLKHFARDGEDFYDQYCLAVERVLHAAPKRILEIGTRTGISICQLLSAHPEREKIEKVVLCDLWNDGYVTPEIVKKNFRALNLSLHNVMFVKGDSKDKVPELEGEFDYILVDGDHSKVNASIDLENAVNKVAIEGIIVFDDISQYGCGLIDVWDPFVKRMEHRFECGTDMRGKGVGWAIRKG